MNVGDILTRAGDTLLDASFVRWTQPELLRYLNDGRYEMAQVRPDLYSKIATVTLIAGTLQSIPTEGFRFLDGVRNVKSDGTPMAAIRVAEREAFDAFNPSWHTTKQSGTIQHFMFDERNPRKFFVYPPAIADTKIDISYAKTPDTVSSNSTELTEEGVLATALVDYVCYRAFAKDTEFGGNSARAAAHFQRFAQAIGSDARIALATSPNTYDIGGKAPAVKG